MSGSERTIDVLLAEDHTIVREGLRALLAGREGIRVVGEAADGREAVAVAERTRPDVVVMDLGMPGLNGVEATRQICRRLPATRVVVLSMHGGVEHVRPAVRAGASGYLIKGAGLSDLVAAIRAVAAGEAFFSPGAAKLLLRDAVAGGGETGSGAAQTLTPREREILQLVAEGRSSRSIGELLHISPKTVEGHRGRVMDKLDIHDVAGLVRYAVRVGLISPE
ncbi:MAG: response regulator transcription factor [Deltaproteobacteria bacterium]|nr:response regulator transcription factor [Deltaproteobacteria bacterium]